MNPVTIFLERFTPKWDQVQAGAELLLGSGSTCTVSHTHPWTLDLIGTIHKLSDEELEALRISCFGCHNAHMTRKNLYASPARILSPMTSDRDKTHIQSIAESVHRHSLHSIAEAQCLDCMRIVESEYSARNQAGLIVQ